MSNWREEQAKADVSIIIMDEEFQGSEGEQTLKAAIVMEQPVIIYVPDDYEIRERGIPEYFYSYVKRGKGYIVHRLEDMDTIMRSLGFGDSPSKIVDFDWDTHDLTISEV